MGNLTTPFKATVVAFLASKMVHSLGMGDHEASYVADAAWMLLTAAITFAVPADFGSGLAARALALVLRFRGGAAVLLAVGLLSGCAEQYRNVSASELRQACAAADLAARACFTEADRKAAVEALATIPTR